MESSVDKKAVGGGTGRVALLFATLSIVVVALVVDFYYINTQSGYNSEYSRQAAELRVLSQQIATQAVEAAAGRSEAFGMLEQSRQDFAAGWKRITQGDDETGLPAATEALSAQLQPVEAKWQILRDGADTILSSKQTILVLKETSETLSEVVPQLQLEYEEIVDILLEEKAPAGQVAVAQRQMLLAERIQSAVSRIRAGGQDAVQAADLFGRDVGLFGRVLDAELQGNPAMQISRITSDDARARLEEVSTLFLLISGSADSVLQTSIDLLQARESAQAILDASTDMLQVSADLIDAIGVQEDGLRMNIWGSYALGGLAVLVIILIGATMMGNTKRRLAETDDKNKRNQDAILRLLDEIGDLADGDLTVEATVTEDFTGAIADSINYSIDQLRDLVTTINATSMQVAAAAQESQTTAINLSEASDHQAQEIAGASAAINEMAVSIDQVSANANESAQVAERSVSIAKKGNEVVHNTIVGMDGIREQIQDTSKRIKRLGESSQEIGDIVSLINDIADQTNILALNAAIQASMAGDAGRGFAVVADEVQRLAERSSVATKQIEALVKAIQNDTNEAVISMEQTTAEVVQGARLTQDAGVALEDIEKVSSSLASLIQNISNAARQQASSAGHISNTMNIIQEITAQTSAGTTTTARSIGNLADLASAMRHSVSGFTLPSSQSAE